MSDAPNHFFEWDYDEGVVVEYERLGECNGCGDCCMAAIQFAVAGKLAAANTDWEASGAGGAETNGQGVWSEVRVNGDRRFFSVTASKPGNVRCQQLTDDMRCKIHLTKPLFHKSWPMAPRQVVPFERCSYTFREVQRWSLASLK